MHRLVLLSNGVRRLAMNAILSEDRVRKYDCLRIASRATFGCWLAVADAWGEASLGPGHVLLAYQTDCRSDGRGL